ncbi:hypothetical protein GLW08_04160 [Pontibacillus yanchengensis]|uniref:Uncharacterized protein n=2 Tax=Pontibacillus yanchengensis TaxID=462910 RepID=A0ACC7VD56_9BACI|nr:HAMP domain-containing histidine kinase [Pontibacillus yanchengensis]MYL35103.1 hypothetical protein [Pontibacillus yanchengensis]MYL52530.1 hypothetical protein [Pontibacillus yanchengensis]
MFKQSTTSVSVDVDSRVCAKALKDDVIQDEQERKEYLSIIEHESKRLSSLSQNLLKLATLDTDHPPFHPIASLEPQWSAKEQGIHLNIEDTTFKAEQDQLEQVWMLDLSTL